MRKHTCRILRRLRTMHVQRDFESCGAENGWLYVKTRVKGHRRYDAVMYISLGARRPENILIWASHEGRCRAVHGERSLSKALALVKRQSEGVLPI